MQVDRYSFYCKKAFHEGLRLCKSLGHGSVEIEHVAAGLLKDGGAPLDDSFQKDLEDAILKALKSWPKLFGNTKISYGSRLLAAIHEIESVPGKIIEKTLWQALLKNSTIIKNAIVRTNEFRKSSRGFSPLHDNGEKGSDNRSLKDSKSQEQESGKFSNLSKQLKPQEASGVTVNEDASSKRALPNDLDEKLRKYTVDLSEIAERGDFDPIIGRDGEVRRIFEILGRKKKNNPLLLGDPGVGKSAIIELLAQKIVAGKVPESMRGLRVLSLDLASLIAGAKFRGEFEERFKNVLDALIALKKTVILFIDEVHMMIGMGNSEGGADIANLLKPVLARGEILCIAATTQKEYKKFFQKDQALDRRFQPIVVLEPTPSETLTLLRNIKSKYELHHGIKITDGALVSAVSLGEKYLPSRRFPDKAIDIIDEACSCVRIGLDSMPPILDQLRTSLDSMEIEKQAIGLASQNKRNLVKLEVQIERTTKEFNALNEIWTKHRALLAELSSYEKSIAQLESLAENVKHEGDFEFTATLTHQKVPELKSRLSHLERELAELEGNHPFLTRLVDEIAVSTVVADWSGIPVGNILSLEKGALSSLEQTLSREVFGQGTALSAVARTIKRTRLGIVNEKKPSGVFLFLGQTGVGKTLAAKVLAKEVFGSMSSLIRIDLSEFTEAHTVSRLIGSPPGYIGHDEGGELTEAIRKRPYSVVLFDEIEKAHPKIFDVMLAMFDDGRMTDSKGETVDFGHAIIILTSNLPVWHRKGDTRDDTLRESLATTFRVEFVNRIDEIIVFSPLGPNQMSSIIDREMRLLNENLESRKIRLTLSYALRQRLIDFALASEYGGRALKREFNNTVINSVSDRLLETDEPIGAWLLDVTPTGDILWELEDEPQRYLPAAPG